MRSALTFGSCLLACLVALGSTACSTARDRAQTGTTYCLNCHSETSALGIKIKWAEAGYEESVHAKGQVERIYTQTLQGGCPPFVQATAATCTGQGGTHSGDTRGNVCTMPASATPTTCAAAGGTWRVPVTDVTVANMGPTGPCPSFNQAPAAAGTAQACIVGGGTYTAGTFTCDTAGITTQNGCETAGGVWLGPRFVLTATEKAGTNSFYANSGGCQMCHTQEGFRKRVAGAYDAPDGSYSIQYAWDTRAQVGSPSRTPNTPLTADVITNPSPLGCFGCHTPHGIGTTDNLTLDQTIPVGTAITTQTGAIYGNATTGQNKAKGHICAECHQVRLNDKASVSASILATATAGGSVARVGPHHGPQADMLLGKGGAEYGGTAGSFTFARSYGNSPHTTNPNADCVSCHMQSDFSDINVTGSFGVSAAVGGHSFTNRGIVHGTEKALVIGCGSLTDTIGCHTVAGVSGSSGNRVVATNFSRTNGYLKPEDALFQKLNGASEDAPDSNYHLEMNELLTRLADPAKNCTGLLQDAAGAASAGRMSWATMPDGSTIDPRCIFNGTTRSLAASAGAADDNGNASVRFVKAIWNFQLVLREDKSFGVHNTTYAQQLLYDSCTDLALLTGKDCGANPGRCSFCEGTYVTARPD